MHAASSSALRDARSLRHARVVPALATLGVAAAFFAIAYEGGAYSLSARTSIAIATWWSVFLGLGLGLVRVGTVPRPAVAVGGAFTALAALTLASALWAPSAETVLEEFNRVTLYLGVFVLVALAARRLPAERWLDAVAVAVAGIVGIALASRFFSGSFDEGALPELLPAASNRLSFPVGYWNGLAVLAALAVPPLLRIAVEDRRSPVRAAAVAPLPAILAVCYLSSSRGGAAAAAVGAIVFVALTRRRWAALGAILVGGAGSAVALRILSARDELANGPLTSPEVPAQGRSAALWLAVVCICCAVAYGGASALAPGRWRPPAAVAWATFAIAAALAVAGLVAARPVERFEAFREPPTELFQDRPDFVTAHFTSGSGSGRWQFWEASLEQFAENPLTGAGAGTFEAWWAEHGALAVFVRDAHSLYLESLAELGPTGLGLVLALLAVGLGAGVARRNRAPEREWAAAATSVVAVYAFAAGIDWMWELTAVSVVAFAALALVTGPVPAPAAEELLSRRPRRPLVAVATAALALVAVAAQGISLLTEAQLEDSRSAAARGDLVEAVELADAARAVQPWAESPYLQLALVEEQAGALERARESIGRAIDRNPRDWRLWVTRFRIETKAGDVDAARQSLERAAALNPRSPLFSDLRG